MPAFNSITRWMSSCFTGMRSQHKDLDEAKLSSVESQANVVGSCPFCKVSAEEGFKVIWEDDTFIAFEDRRPASLRHFQLIPRKHIGDYRPYRNHLLSLSG
ncbi:hypothetical protein V5O48_012332 [Marasmius crinis-equi]|uniref:HIT domain-containing protein n=1 Tax=Marasmius crinis-equi TaxID=585013 RepID=A0ABR3F324_9AGAR